MVLKRVIPCLLFNGNSLLKTVRFKGHDYVGDPTNAIKIYNEKEVDELILLDIFATKEKRKPLFDKIEDFASECFMPFTYGGGVSEISDFQKLFAIGVEKIAVKNLIFERPKVVIEAVRLFGAQAIIGVMDVYQKMNGQYAVQTGAKKKNYTIQEYVAYLQDEIGVGEILVQNISREGTWEGYDHALISAVLQSTKVPIIALGGAKDVSDVKKVLYDTGAEAAAIGNMAVYQKKGMGVLIRFPKREDIIEEEWEN